MVYITKRIHLGDNGMKCNTCKQDVDSYYGIYGTIYCSSCFKQSPYWKGLQTENNAYTGFFLLFIIPVIFTIILTIIRLMR